DDAAALADQRPEVDRDVGVADRTRGDQAAVLCERRDASAERVRPDGIEHDVRAELLDARVVVGKSLHSQPAEPVELLRSGRCEDLGAERLADVRARLSRRARAALDEEGLAFLQATELDDRPPRSAVRDAERGCGRRVDGVRNRPYVVLGDGDELRVGPGGAGDEDTLARVVPRAGSVEARDQG